MSRMRDLRKEFPNAKACKTAKGAEARITKAIEHWDDNDKSRVGFLWTVQQREDGFWIAIAILSDRNTHLITYLIHRGICVINA